MKPVNVGMPDGTMRVVKEIGTICLSPKIKLRNVLLIPEFKHNLLSVSRLMEQTKLRVIFTDDGCSFQDPSSGETVGIGMKH